MADVLSDLGERRIINEILSPRYKNKGIKYFGNDCALISEIKKGSGEGFLVGTTDPCPEPMASILGFNDFYYRGWLLSTINLSDIAASGARPLGLLTSLILPNEMLINDFNRLLDGIDECCELCGTNVIGGNIKESPNIQLSATAFGICDQGKSFSRNGASLGDAIVVIGDLGLFWSGVLSVRNSIKIEKKNEEILLRNILRPKPKIRIAQKLASLNLLSSCMDNSDGLYPTLAQLSEMNGLKALIDLDGIKLPEIVVSVCVEMGIDPIRTLFGWGDWQLIGSTDQKNLSQLMDIGEEYQIPIHKIGNFTEGNGVFLNVNEQQGPMFQLDSQRFTKESWFTAGIESYIDAFLSKPLIDIL